jgi:hypothetical protein
MAHGWAAGWRLDGGAGVLLRATVDHPSTPSPLLLPTMPALFRGVALVSIAALVGAGAQPLTDAQAAALQLCWRSQSDGGGPVIGKCEDKGKKCNDAQNNLDYTADQAAKLTTCDSAEKSGLKPYEPSPPPGSSRRRRLDVVDTCPSACQDFDDCLYDTVVKCLDGASLPDGLVEVLKTSLSCKAVAVGWVPLVISPFILHHLSSDVLSVGLLPPTTSCAAAFSSGTVAICSCPWAQVPRPRPLHPYCRLHRAHGCHRRRRYWRYRYAQPPTFDRTNERPILHAHISRHSTYHGSIWIPWQHMYT